MTEPQVILETLRSRLLRGLTAGTLAPGDRLPSARELVSEFKVDNRLILSAYRQLAEEGLVEVRERGGVYVEKTLSASRDGPAWPLKWFADTFAEGLSRGVSATQLAENLRRAIETVRLRAIVISSTADQVAGLRRELREDFGLESEGLTASALSEMDDRISSSIRRSDLLIVTDGHAELGGRIASEFGKPCVVISVRSDFMLGEWSMLLRQPLWVVVATDKFGEMLKHFLSGLRGIENLHIIVHGRDNLDQIPAGTPTYVTHRVRETLGATTIPGRILPPARTISQDSARRIFSFIIESNVRASHALMDVARATASRK